MPIIEDVTFCSARSKRRSASAIRKVMRFENSLVRPRKGHNSWDGQYSGHVFKLGNGNELAVSLPVENYQTKKKDYVENSKRISKLVLNHFENYCDKSTLHGLRYVGDTSLSYAERFFWFLAFILAFTFACYYISNIFERWNTNPVLVAFNPTDATFEDIPFPAITICNMNQVKKTEADKIIAANNLKEKQLVDAYCNVNDQTYSSKEEAPGWDVLQKFLIRVGQSCNETLKSCIWQSVPVSCDVFFNNDLTDEGLCCSFNRLPPQNIFRNPNDVAILNHTYPHVYDWSPEKGFLQDNGGGYTVPYRPIGAGAHLGLTITVDAQLDNYYCSSTNSIGFKIIISNPIETPKIADYGFLVSPGVEARYIIKPDIKEAKQTLRSIDVNKRQCYFQDERPLLYYRSYTTRNCRLECQSNYTLSTCHCIPYYLPKSKVVPICGKHDEECMAQAKADMELVTGNGSSCNCLPSCYEMNFDKSATYSQLNKMGLKHRFENVSDEYFRKNMAVLHFFFSENRFRKQIKSEIYGFTEVLSNVGGLLGLCLGFSILSVVEMIYFFTLKLLCGFLLSKRKKEKKNSENLGRYERSVIPFVR